MTSFYAIITREAGFASRVFLRGILTKTVETVDNVDKSVQKYYGKPENVVKPWKYAVCGENAVETYVNGIIIEKSTGLYGKNVHKSVDNVDNFQKSGKYGIFHC